MADRLDYVFSLRKPFCGRGVERAELVGLAPPQLELQQVREHAVVAKPGAPRIQRHHERVGLF